MQLTGTDYFLEQIFDLVISAGLFNKDAKQLAIQETGLCSHGIIFQPTNYEDRNHKNGINRFI